MTSKKELCKNIKAHHEQLKDDPERLSTRFIKSLVGMRVQCPSSCPIVVTCQKRNNPPAACRIKRASTPRSGFNSMGFQEYQMRMSAIENRGDWSV